jgi:hypothetical protein
MFGVQKTMRIIMILCLMLSLCPYVPTKCQAEESAGTEQAEAVPERKLPELAAGKWEPLFEMGETIFPSVAVSTATLKEGLWDDAGYAGDPWGVIGVVVRSPSDNCPIRVEVSGGSYIKASVLTGTLPKKDTIYRVYPHLNYDYEKLLSVKQTIPENLSFKVSIGGKDDPARTVRVQVRPVNECVYYLVDSTGRMNDLSFLFAAYVNENHPEINQILKEAIMSKKVDSFMGYSGDRESLMKEIDAIWQILKQRRVHYSTMSASTEDSDPYIGTQFVRLIGESISYAQANCVDGSVLMASIFRKIGLDVSLVQAPEHMFLAVSLDPDSDEFIFIETTDIGDGDLEEAVEDGKKEYEENKARYDSDKDEDSEYNMINIQTARSIGIMPIKDTTAN